MVTLILTTYVGAFEVQDEVNRCDDSFKCSSLRLFTRVAKKHKLQIIADRYLCSFTYPSIKKPVEFSTLAIAAARSSRTTSLLTSPPLDIVSWSSLPFGDPEATSALNKSPVDK